MYSEIMKTTGRAAVALAGSQPLPFTGITNVRFPDQTGIKLDFPPMPLYYFGYVCAAFSAIGRLHRP